MSKKEADAHFTECFAKRKALIASGRALDEDNDISDYCHFDSEGYAEPCEEYVRLDGAVENHEKEGIENGY